MTNVLLFIIVLQLFAVLFMLKRIVKAMEDFSKIVELTQTLKKSSDRLDSAISENKSP